MGINLTNLYISESFSTLLQKSGSKVTTGLGVDVSSLDLSVTSATSATTAGTANTASYVAAANIDGTVASATSATSASYAITSSLPLKGFVSVSEVGGNLRFTKGDGTFQDATITVSGSVESAVSASHAIYAETAGVANSASSVAGANVNGAVANATNTRYVNVQPNAINSNYFPSFTNGTGENTTIYIDLTGYTYNPSNNKLTVGNISATTLSGSLFGNATTATSASHALVADTVTGTVTNATYAQNTITTGKNLEATEIAKGTPLYFTGSGTSGNIVGILRADAGNPARMPAGGVAGEAIASGAEGVVLLDGFINGVNTSAFAAGQKVYVGVGGGYTNVEPTGSANLIQFLGNVEKSAVNGSGVIQMMGEARRLPNIAQNNVWLGDANGVPQSVNQNTLSVASAVSASHALVSDTVNDANVAYQNQNNNFTGTQTFNNIAVNGTGSFAYIQQVTGSAKIIGDAFIILNNDTPTERYAGIVVQDSGSGSPLTTASLQFDGQTNDWFYEYSNDGGATVDHGVVIFGPEYDTKGSPTYLTTNKLPKSSGSHHIVDSNISDDGTDVTIAANLGVQGDIVLNGVFDSIFVNGLAGQIRANNLSGSWGQTNGTYTLDIIGNVGASTGFVGDLTGNADTATSASHAIIADSSLTSNTSVSASHAVNADSATSASYAANAGEWDGTYVGNASITGSLIVSSSKFKAQTTFPSNFSIDQILAIDGYTSATTGDTWDKTVVSVFNFGAFGKAYDGRIEIAKTDIPGNIYGTWYNSGYEIGTIFATVSGSQGIMLLTTQNDGSSLLTLRADGTNMYSSTGTYMSSSNGFPLNADGTMVTRRIHMEKNPFNNDQNGNLYASRLDSTNITHYQTLYNTNAGQSITSQSVVTQYLDSGSGIIYTEIGAANYGSVGSIKIENNQGVRTYTISADSGTITSNTNFVGDSIFSGSVRGEVSSVSIASATASLDAGTGNYFTVTLVSGSNTHIDASNLAAGQTYILKTAQPTSAADSHGTISFAPKFKFAGGTAPTATATSGSIDIYTFVSFDNTNVFSTAVADLK